MDDRLRALARAARAEAEAAIDVDDELAATMRRTPTDVEPRRALERQRRRTTAWVAAAAVALVAGGLVVLRSVDDDTLQTVDPQTSTAISSPSSSPATTAPSTPTSTSTSSTTSTVTGGPVAATLAVDIANPPMELDLVAFATIPYEEDGRPDVAVGELGVVVNLPERGAIASIGFSGEQRTIELSDELASAGLSNLVYGPGDVVYGLRLVGPPFGFEMVAVPLSGSRSGEVVARSQSLGAAAWVELPVSAFGHGPEGIVARARDVGATLIGYVDVDGAPTTYPGVVPHFATVDDQLVVTTENFAADWPLEINGNRSPQPSFTGPAVPAPATDNRTVYATYLRPNAGEGDDELPVVAVLEANGAGSWGSVPDGYDYLASDATGTVFGRIADGALQLSLLAGGSVNWRTLRYDGSGIAEPCVGCTQLLVGADGIPVTYDPTTRQLLRHSVPPVEATLPDRYGESPYLYHLGPENVVYLQVAPSVEAELGADIVAVSLSADNAGSEVGRWADVAYYDGDSELVATAQGLVNVNCCGPDIVRPDPESPVLVPWLDSDGEAIRSPSASIQVEISYPTLTVHRVDQVPATTQTWTYEPGGDWQPRGMPTIMPTLDGGFVAATYGSGTTIARGWSDGTVETIRLDDTITFPGALDPSGRFHVADGGFFLRVEPFADRTDYWNGDIEVDAGATGAIRILDLDTTLDTGPSWATEPIAFGNAVSGRPEVNEIRSIEAEQRSEIEWLVTVTTSNLFDDSVTAVRWELVLNRNDAGQFRFVSGTQTTVCAPGRGHQDFSAQLCV
jgi:hypothetical protein